MQIITETTFDVKTSTDDNKRLFIEGIFATANKKNANGRVYEKSLWEREINKILPKVTENSLIGELNHPIDRADVDFNEAALKITSLKWDGDNIIGKAMVLSTPKGQLVKNLIDDGVRVGISSRGLGSVKPISEDGTVEVQEDFEILCWDFVSNPSTQGAFMKPLHESVGQDLDPKIKRELNLYFEVNSLINDILKGE